MINVVSSLELSSSGICQNPLLASNLLKTVAPASCARVSSTFGMGWVSRSTHSLMRRKSTQMRSEPDLLGTTTMPEHQGVGLSERDITPSNSIRPSSFCTFFLKGIGTTRGVNKANGLVSGARLILKLSGNVTKPVK